MRIGILGHRFMEWGGGIDFLRLTVSSLQAAGEPVEFHALVPTKGPRLLAHRAARYGYTYAKAVIGRTSARPPRPDSRQLVDLSGTEGLTVQLHEIDLGATAIAKAANRLALDVLIPAFTPLPRRFSTPWVGYVYDFQHRYLPQLFSARGCRERDREFSSMLTNASAVIVNARNVEADIARFHPESTARIFSLPFGAAPQAAWLLPHKSPASRLGIGRPYFIICNQFWQHKDHETAFAAFAQIARLHPNVDLVCTGATEDYRDLEYFPTLERTLTRDGISSRVHILGMVDKADQIALVKDSIALIQPTLFEGGPGGGAVYDAVSLGVRCIVSDIPVNRELAEPTVYFFAAGDAHSLAAQLMLAIARPPTPKPDVEVLREMGRARRAACGTTLWEAIDHARSLHKSQSVR